MKRIYRIYKEEPSETFYDHKGMLRVAEKIASRDSLDPDPTRIKDFDNEADAFAFHGQCQSTMHIYRGHGSVKELQVVFYSLQVVEVDDDGEEDTVDYLTDNSPALDEILAVIDPQDEEEEN